MKRFLLTIGVFLILAGQGWAATYHVGPGGDYTTLAQVNAATFNPGDVIDGGGNTFQERLVPPSSGSAGGGYITFQNFIIDGRISLDGTWTYDNASNYTEYDGWHNLSGEIYYKYCFYWPLIVLEDGNRLTPMSVAATDEATVAANLARGQYTWTDAVAKRIYYRASDGADPSTHVIKRDCRYALDASHYGMIYNKNKSYLKFKDISIIYNASTAWPTGFVNETCDHIALENVDLSYNTYGFQINTCTNVSLDTACSSSYNIGNGLGIQGNSDTITLRGEYIRNGGSYWYPYTPVTNAPSWGSGDRDNIGIGGSGGTMTNITVENATVTYSGNEPPAGKVLNSSTGIFMGSASAMTVTNFIVRNCFISNNHAYGCYLGDEGISGSFYNNIVLNNGSADADVGSLYVNITRNAGFTGYNIYNNTFAFNTHQAAIFVRAPVTTGILNIKNNIFYDNGSTGWGGDILFLDAATTYIGEAYNCYYRSAGSWGTTRVIKKVSTYWDLAHIVGESATYWQFDTGQGANDLVADPLFVNAGGSLILATDFRLQSGSPCKDAGIDVGLTTDYFGLGYVNGFPIGAAEYAAVVNFTTYSKNAVLNHILKVSSYTPATTVYLGLFTADPTAAGTLTDEANYTGYARQAISFGAASNRGLTQSGTCTFPQATAGSSTVTYWAVLDGGTAGAGNMLAYGPLDSSKTISVGKAPVEVSTGVTIAFAPGAFPTTYANSILDWMFRNQTLNQPTNIYLALTSSASRDNTMGTELAGSGYARTQENNWATATTGSSYNSDNITFPRATGTWSGVVGTANLDDSTAGTWMMYGATTKTLNAKTGDYIRFPAGAITVTMP